MKRRNKIIASLTSVLGIVLIWTSGCLPFVAPPQRPVTYERSADGTMNQKESSGLAWPGLEVTAARGKTELRSSQEFSIRGEKPFRVAYRDVVVLAMSKDRYLHRVAAGVAGRLAKSNLLQRVRFLPAGCRLPAGEKAPDWVLTFDLRRKSELWLPFVFYSGLEAVVHVTTSWTPDQDVHIWLDGERLPSLPVAAMGFRATVSGRSRVWGYESTPAEYSIAADPVIDSIARGILDSVQKNVNELGCAPALPAALEGRYREPQLPAQLLEYRPLQVFSGSAPLRHHVTSWSFENEGDYHKVLEGLHGRLLAGGWRPTTTEWYDPSTSHRFYLQKGVERLYIEADAESTPPPLAGTAEVQLDYKWERPTHRYAVQLVEGFTGDEVRATLAAALVGDMSADCREYLESLLRTHGIGDEPAASEGGSTESSPR